MDEILEVAEEAVDADITGQEVEAVDHTIANPGNVIW